MLGPKLGVPAAAWVGVVTNLACVWLDVRGATRPSVREEGVSACQRHGRFGVLSALGLLCLTVEVVSAAAFVALWYELGGLGSLYWYRTCMNVWYYYAEPLLWLALISASGSVILLRMAASSGRGRTTLLPLRRVARLAAMLLVAAVVLPALVGC